MFLNDLFSTIQWWSLLLLVTVFFLPISSYFFKNFIDKGYIFSKTLGITITSYVIFLGGTLHLFSFSRQSSFIVLFLLGIFSYLFFRKFIKISRIIIFEEIFFLVGLLFWVYIKAHQPDIQGLEKYMDFGFINSILRSSYFPAKDMWFTPLSINYYYFGHLVTAVLTKLINIPSSITFNLMLCTIFALTITSAFSIGLNLFSSIDNSKKLKNSFICGLITAILVGLAGNLQVIYVFFKSYSPNPPVPFWNLPLSLSTIPNSYWYPNATRFIYNTIHEFPIYSFVVSDLHGHVLDIPFVLTVIALLFSLLKKLSLEKRQKLKELSIKEIIILGFLLSVIYMTNAWDGIIYLLLTSSIIFLLYLKTLNLSDIFKNPRPSILLKTAIKPMTHIVLIGIIYFVFSLPFNLFFSPFVSGIGILCAPTFLTNIGNLGPFLFEENHCQNSPLWQLFILYGFFYFFVFSYFIFIIKKKITSKNESSIFVLLLILLSSILIVIPEVIYVKDIYPAHYRANTMFKLVYQAFIMLSLSCGFIIIQIVSLIKRINFYKISVVKKILLGYYLFAVFFVIFIVLLYPYFAVNSYFNSLKQYKGIDGFSYFKTLYPSDYEAINWLNSKIEKQPVILEAQGDSYTDYARVSANTGLPTVLGWTVHEWLWRKTYNIPAPRIEEVKTIYESSSIERTKNLLKIYNVKYVFIGNLEKQKYTNLKEDKFKTLGRIIYQKGTTKIYKLNNTIF